jgi:hypothetical protein
MMRLSRSTRRAVIILLSVVGLALLVSVTMALYVVGHDQSGPSTQSSESGVPDHLSNSVTLVGPITFRFVGGNSSALTVVAGSTVYGTMSIDVLQAAPLRFYIDDRRYNATGSTLPAGISISFNMYGNSYDPFLLSTEDDQPLSAARLIPTTLGVTTVRYTISSASNVPKGVYGIRIVCWSFLNNGTIYNRPESYWVTLSVQ